MNVNVKRLNGVLGAIGLLCGLYFVLAGCSASQTASLTKAAATPAGQLFCAVNSTTGPIVEAIIDAAASTTPAGPIAVIATGMAKSQVDAICAAAGGIAVSPPVTPATAPQVAVVVPTA